MASRESTGRGARRSRRPNPRRRFVPPPNSGCWIESDSYDRDLFARLCQDSPSLREAKEAGGRLVPHFAALVEDLFSLCFKNTLVFKAQSAVAPSAHSHRPVLDRLAGSAALAELRHHTVLDEVQAGLGTVLLAEELLDQLRRQRLWTGDDMRDLWELAAQETVARETIEAYETAVELSESQEPTGDEPEDPSEPDSEAESENASQDEPGAGEAAQARRHLPPGATKRAAVQADNLAREADLAEARLRQKSRRVLERARSSSGQALARTEARALATAQQLSDGAQSGEAGEQWGFGAGGGRRSSPGAQVELGKRLTKNPKLKQLARLVGRMHASALRLRKRMLEQANTETHQVSRGGELGRLLAHELVTLKHPVLRREFQRRLVEGDLQLYELRGLEEKGRGPMIVCLDGSSSMAGDKEVWSKAVALTLLDIARRQRRLFRFMCFSSADQPLWTLDLNPRTRYAVDEHRVYDLAEYFPGGGTDFQRPLDAAVECLAEARFKRGDIVLITDGECQVSPQWLDEFRSHKARLGCFVFSVLIDVGTSAVDTVRQFSDRVTTIQRLTDDAADDLFVAL